MNHTEIINFLIENNDYKSYLEIGVYDGNNFNSINCVQKECCDTCEEIKNPFCTVNYIMTSDEMFEQIPNDKKYDIIFIDAMHDEAFVDRDLTNSLKHLNENGIICLHDTLPISESCAAKYSTYLGHGTWCGDVFKSILKLNQTDLEYYTVNNGDFGLTLVKYKKDFNTNLSSLKTEYNYNDIFVSSTTPTDLGNKLLNVISVTEFINKFKK